MKNTELSIVELEQLKENEELIENFIDSPNEYTERSEYANISYENLIKALQKINKFFDANILENILEKHDEDNEASFQYFYSEFSEIDMINSDFYDLYMNIIKFIEWYNELTEQYKF